MLSDGEFNEYCIAHGLSAAAYDYVRYVRESEPSRKVGEYATNNVSGDYPSTKMGRTIQSESHTLESLLLVTYEFDVKVLEFWDQPSPVIIHRSIKGGRKRNSSYTPDFLVLREDGVFVVEAKTEEKLTELAERYPSDWICDGDGCWSYLPARNVYEKIGLVHVVVSSSTVNPIEIANKELLLRVDRVQVREEKKKIIKSLEEAVLLSIDDVASVAEFDDVEPVLCAILRGTVYTNITDQLLTNTDSVYVALDKEKYELAKSFLEDSSKQDVVGDIDVWRVPSSHELEKAYERLKRLESGLNNRSARRWRALICDGESKGLSPLQSLIPKTRNSGNRTPRVPVVVEEYIAKYIKEKHSTPIRMIAARSYNTYCVDAKEAHPEYPPVSHVTFRLRIRQFNQQEIQYGRGGRRAANAAAEPTDVTKRGMRPTRAFQLVSLDHYRGDIALIVVESNGQVYTAFPWVTAMVDVFSGVVIAFWVSFKAPSTLSCSMVMRDCARRYKKLPEAVVVDHGADFKSIYFRSFLAHFGIERVSRPPGNPRYGSEVERLFRDFKSLWISTLPGNVVNYQESRSVSGTHSPQKVATMSIESFYKEMGEFVQWRNGVVKSDEIHPPIKKLGMSVEKFGGISGQPVVVNKEFIVTSAVDARQYSVDRIRGIHIDERWYWTPELTTYSVKKSDIEVRREPENPYIIYALIGNKWVDCLNQRYQTFDLKRKVARQSESLRVMEGRSLRDLAKKEANEAFIAQVAARNAEVDDIPELNASDEEGSEVGAKESTFSQFIDSDIGDIDVGTW